VDDLLSADKLKLFVAFVIPGFISLKCYQLLFPGKEQPTSDQLVDAVAYSAINYALLSLPILWVETAGLYATNQWTYYAFYVCVIFFAPVVWVLAWKFIRTRTFFQQHVPHPTGKAWDYVFSSQKTPCWVKVHLKDGKVIGGYYGLKSFTSSAPADEQIYLEESWQLNDSGGFVRRHRRTHGVLVTCDVSHIEFRTTKDDPREHADDDREHEGQSREGLPTDAAS
jgi:hypothetical protein